MGKPRFGFWNVILWVVLLLGGYSLILRFAASQFVRSSDRRIVAPFKTPCTQIGHEHDL